MTYIVNVPGWVEPFKDENELWSEHAKHVDEKRRKHIWTHHKSILGKKTTKITFVYDD